MMTCFVKCWVNAKKSVTKFVLDVKFKSTQDELVNSKLVNQSTDCNQQLLYKSV